MRSIADQVKDKKIEGISDIRDESSKEGMRIVISLKRKENAQIILNQLYKQTQLKTSFGIIFLALDAKNQPRIFNLKEMLLAFITHRKEVITRRAVFDLQTAEERLHILEGFEKALDSINEVIEKIKKAKDVSEARTSLVQNFSFSLRQAQAILEMRLQKLTGLERKKIEEEVSGLEELILKLKKILAEDFEVFKILKTELLEIKEKFAKPRFTKIEEEEGEFLDKDLIPKESCSGFFNTLWTYKKHLS